MHKRFLQIQFRKNMNDPSKLTVRHEQEIYSGKKKNKRHWPKVEEMPQKIIKNSEVCLVGLFFSLSFAKVMKIEQIQCYGGKYHSYAMDGEGKLVQFGR